MPTYEYHCEHCGPFDLFQEMTADALTACPKCKRPVRRVPQAVNFTCDVVDWSTENSGRGRFLDQLAEHPGDTNAYCRSLADAEEKLKAKEKDGWTYTRCK